ncbi:MAG: hypothetical protein R2845_00955 [Thermomicrobiales bacterium]
MNHRPTTGACSALETGHGQASQLVFDFNKPPEPPDPNHFYHYEKLLFNKVYWYIVSVRDCLSRQKTAGSLSDPAVVAWRSMSR